MGVAPRMIFAPLIGFHSPPASPRSLVQHERSTGTPVHHSSGAAIPHRPTSPSRAHCCR